MFNATWRMTKGVNIKTNESHTNKRENAQSL